MLAPPPGELPSLPVCLGAVLGVGGQQRSRLGLGVLAPPPVQPSHRVGPVLVAADPRQDLRVQTPEKARFGRQNR
jgi:hypothetical protein